MRLLVLTLAALSILQGPAAAGCVHKDRDFSALPESVARKHKRREAEMRPMDLNCDGVLQKQELDTSIENKFSSADKDNDGRLSEDEISSYALSFQENSQELLGKMAASNSQRLLFRMNKMDSNRDGFISPDEHRDYFNRRYKKLDGNNDGDLTISEYETDYEKNLKDKKNPRN